MQTIIDNAIEQINQGTGWILKNAKVDKKKSYKALVKERRALRKIRSTCDTKATVVLYGQSQCGKSHLSSSLLSADGKPMQVVDRLNGVNYEFLTHLNPRGSGEATGLLTRFTMQSQSNCTREFPVHIKLMSIKDIALMLCDGYYKDLESREPFSIEYIQKLIGELKSSTNTPSQQCICEDDIGDIEDYFRLFSKDVYYALSEDSTDYFFEISKIIKNLSDSDIIKALCMLWNNEPNLSETFSVLYNTCKAIEFAKEAYISFDELDNSKGTLLDVGWLDLKDTETKSTVQFKDRDGKWKTAQLSKTYLATICAEVVLEVIPPENTLAKENGCQKHYRNKKKEEIEEEKVNYLRIILENADVLDFPGARERGGIKDSSGKEGMILRRGKVGYYFNKYSLERRVNTLLFCWEPDNFIAKPMEDVLRNWIDITIGRDENERGSFLSGLDYPPLFFVGTKFNELLKKQTDDRQGNTKALNGRWEKWFIEQLSRDIVGMPIEQIGMSEVQYKQSISNNCRWFESWTEKESFFNNLYLLRDFQYSDKIFEGWTEETLIEECRKPGPYDGFYEELRESFIHYDFVKKHFRDAANRWDEASEANCDGSLPIVRNLASIIEKIAAAAAAKNMRDIKEAITNVIAELKKHYYNTDTEESLKKALNAAARLQASLDNAFARDPHYFGRFMKSVTITEYAVHEVFAEVFPTVTNAGNVGDYVFIYMRAPGIKPTNSFDDNMHILRAAYGFTNEEECRQYFENNLGVNLEELFRRSEFGLQSPSRVLAATLKKYWFEGWLRGSQRDRLCSMLGENSFEEMVEMYYCLFEKYEMESRISKTIHNYVDTFGVNVQQLSEMIADICSEMINKFVLTVGYDYYSEEEGVVENLKEASSKHKIELNFDFIDEERQPADNGHIAALMSQMDDMERTRQMLMSPSSHSIDELSAIIPGFRQSRRWSDLAKIGFVLTNDIPHYDVEANDRLGRIIEECRTLNK